jgi:hypothetical protein
MEGLEREELEMEMKERGRQDKARTKPNESFCNLNKLTASRVAVSH